MRENIGSAACKLLRFRCFPSLLLKGNIDMMAQMCNRHNCGLLLVIDGRAAEILSPIVRAERDYNGADPGLFMTDKTVSLI